MASLLEMRTLSCFMLMVSPPSSIFPRGFLVIPRARISQKQILTTSLVALVTGQLSKEITVLGKEIEKLFGVLNEDLLKLQ